MEINIFLNVLFLYDNFLNNILIPYYKSDNELFYACILLFYLYVVDLHIYFYYNFMGEIYNKKEF